MHPTTLRWVRRCLALLLVIDAIGLYYAWPYLHAIGSHTAEVIQGLVTYAAGIATAAISFKILMLVKLLLGLCMFIASTVLKLAVLLLPQGILRFLVKLAAFTGLTRLYNRSKFLQYKWRWVQVVGRRKWRTVWKWRVLRFWKALPVLEKTALCVLTGPAVIFPVIILWLYDGIRLWIAKKFGVISAEKLVKKISENKYMRLVAVKFIEKVRPAKKQVA